MQELMEEIMEKWSRIPSYILYFLKIFGVN